MQEFNISQKEAQRDIARGRLFINGLSMQKSGEYIEGEFEYVRFESSTKGLLPIFEEEEFALFDKPSGVLVHPQNRYTPYSLVDEVRYLFGNNANITHRLDQETSGLVLISKNKNSEIELKRLFEHRKIKKTYTAIVHGKIEDEFLIDKPLLTNKFSDDILKTLVVVDDMGKSSQTYIKPLKYFADQNMTLIEVNPRTGRQHQIRVHLFHVKHPIVGDPVYGQCEESMIRYFNRELSRNDRLKMSGATRLLLHASKLEFSFNNKEYVIHTKQDFLTEAFQSFLM